MELPDQSEITDVINLNVGDSVLVSGTVKRVMSTKRARAPVKLIVGGPDYKTAVAIELSFEDGQVFLVHPRDPVVVVRRHRLG